jgi:glycosyltransferase involved in cell wall biosynthesis
VRLLAYTDSRETGGAELALGFLIGALGPEFDVGLLGVDRAVLEGIATHRAGTRVGVVRAPRGRRDRSAFAAHLGAMRAFAPQILHANQAYPWACGYAEMAALLTPRVRVLAVDHLPIAGAIPRVNRVARRLLARRLHAHVSVGERSARLIEQIVGLPLGSVDSIPNGVPAAVTAVPPPPRVAPAPVIGSLGRLTPQKGYDALVRALPALPGASVVLVGDGPERTALEALAAEIGVADRLHITGWTSDARRYLPTFDVFALPSRWEGMPLVILEAMHAGLAVVATDVGSVAECVADDETGYVVPRDDQTILRDRLAALVADAPLRRRLGERGRAVAAERFTASAMARRYEAVYRRMVAVPG